MRLFIAINFDEKTKDQILSRIANLKKITKRGNFTRKENLHLTLVFIGESNRVKEIISVMQNIQKTSFSLKFQSLGKFRRGENALYFLKGEEPKDLVLLYKNLAQELLKMGFPIEQREFKAHVTLGREVEVLSPRMEEELSLSFKNIFVDVHSISLMKSERIAGKLQYTEIFKKELF